MNKPRVIAFYLPQFHPILENDIWWGKGFTEWTNVGKAKPLFPGHQQPKVPSELGYYDLRVPETREAQAALAKEYGIEGFCYWHYWFGNGKQLLERPFSEVLSSGKPEFPFCLAWANESWRGFWHGLKDRQTLIEQEYPGDEDYINHFYSVLPAFQDKRYITIGSKPIFVVYHPLDMPEMRHFIELWRDLAKKNGLKDIFFIGMANFEDEIDTITSVGFDAVNISRFYEYKKHRQPFFYAVKSRLIKLLYGCPHIVYYKNIVRYLIGEESKQDFVFPTVFPNWDHTPRTKKEGTVFYGSSPELFKMHLKNAVDNVSKKTEELQIIFIKSWNEWGEGNYIEPDLYYGRQYLEAIKDVLSRNQ